MGERCTHQFFNDFIWNGVEESLGGGLERRGCHHHEAAMGGGCCLIRRRGKEAMSNANDSFGSIDTKTMLLMKTMMDVNTRYNIIMAINVQSTP